MGTAAKTPRVDGLGQERLLFNRITLLGLFAGLPLICPMANAQPSSWYEPNVAIASQEFLRFFDEACLATGVDLSAAKSYVEGSNFERVDSQPLENFFHGVIPNEASGFVIVADNLEVGVILSVAGHSTKEIRRLASVGLKVRTLPVDADAPMPNPLNLFPEGAIGWKNCAIVARVFDEDVVVQGLDRLELSGVGLSKIRNRDVQTGPTGKTEAARHWFSGMPGPTINLFSRRNPDGSATVKLSISEIVLAEHSRSSYAVD
jgi:hypothetical protein